MISSTLQPTAPAQLPPALAPADALRVAVGTDDAEALQSWRQLLAAEGVAVERLPPLGSTALRWPAQVVVLHLQSGVGCGLSRLRELRDRLPLAPLVVWCKGLRDLDQVLALELGVDDVLDAAASAAVLAARLRALYRRCGRAAGVVSAPDELRFGRLCVELQTRRVTMGLTEVQLTDGEFDVLWLLASRAGVAVARQELLRLVRGLDLAPHDRSIDSRVYRLRNKLRDGGAGMQRIRTVRNRGYVFSPSDC